MANKAFVGINPASLGSGPGGTGTVEASGIILDPDGNGLGAAVGTANFHYSDSSQAIHEQLADAIREFANDPDLIVIFLDSPGRY
jgi:hypothetical protein